jgi:hypothetical protein
VDAVRAARPGVASAAASAAAWAASGSTSMASAAPAAARSMEGCLRLVIVVVIVVVGIVFEFCRNATHCTKISNASKRESLSFALTLRIAPVDPQ